MSLLFQPSTSSVELGGSPLWLPILSPYRHSPCTTHYSWAQSRVEHHLPRGQNIILLQKEVRTLLYGTSAACKNRQKVTYFLEMPDKKFEDISTSSIHFLSTFYTTWGSTKYPKASATGTASFYEHIDTFAASEQTLPVVVTILQFLTYLFLQMDSFSDATPITRPKLLDFFSPVAVFCILCFG